MKMTAECVYCIFKQIDRNYMMFEKDSDKRMKFIKTVCREVAEADEDITSPEIHGKMMSMIASELGKEDLFEQEKHTYNRAILKMEKEIQQHIDEAEDKLYRALQYAMTGNYIDFGALAGIDEEKLHELIESATGINLGQTYQQFKEDMQKAKSMVYLHDNCGEIVFDKMCIAEIKALYPDLKITAIVRGMPILNDVTMIDAKEVGLTDIVPVVDNGTAMPGTVLTHISAQAKALIDEADVIIAKGMGNYESLDGCGLNIYYLLLCKCERFMREFGKPYLGSVFANERE